MLKLKMTSAKWLLALAAGAAMTLSCNLRGSDDVETVEPGGGKKTPPTSTGNGTEVVEQWATVERPGLAAELNRVTAVTAGAAEVLFMNCDSPPCVVRVRAGTLADTKAALQKIANDYQGRVNFTARQQLDAYSGSRIELDVVVDTDKTRPIPESEDELLTTD
jgi:hypothetical protein